MIYVETLLYVVKDGRVLLIRKKRGLGAGLFNGVGGKVKPGETPEEAAAREALEEVGVAPVGLEWRGLLEFWNFEDGAVESAHYVHVFVARGYRGELRETDEAAPVWFNVEEIPFGEMWEDDKFWLPVVLRGGRVYGRFEFESWRLKRWRLYKLLEETG
ncbi:8-oxo-dGTP diphosphatase [Pyrobaculum neutrophilum]|uniref:Oxidized purine nucleoside triphosphate hydrolase n=1 Tax=Pyrobaculum neutrophilum (strain DSM 2338 / JCM 9278 / NBRC 100436 / V24Sta) TaxID=444157 RepID=B1Y9A8_PYRNV|nr:NUDIX domain-containing protein [Pyrobaculum neutrophilum]ACB40337.1 NUDIX hydrolase [Pyrobaculum neutrophilum V24Sta]